MMRTARTATKVILGTAVLALTPFVPALQGDGVEAGVRASVQIGVTTPVAVFGFSYNDPYVFGHVHATPHACVHGPLYYYPAYGVYGHYVARHRYVRYTAPRYYMDGRPYLVRRNVYAPRPYSYRPRPIAHPHDHSFHGKGHGKGHHGRGHKVR